MKKLVVLISSVLFFSCSKNLQNNTNVECEFSEPPSGVLAWDYPVKPGMPEWANFKSLEEMVNACQIPKHVLSSLSTEDLTVICLQYPLLVNAFAFNLLDMGLDRLFENFNGIRELFNRTEVAQELLKHYHARLQGLDILDDKSASDLEKGNQIISVYEIEVLLSRYQSLDNSTGNYKQILKCLVAGYEKQSKYDYFNGPGCCYQYYSRIRTILKISPQSIERIPEGDGNAIFSPHTPDKETADVINELSYKLIK
jgi:hypothetical protein